MKPASCNLQTSSAIARSRSWVNTRFFWWMGGKEGDTFNLALWPKGRFLACLHGFRQIHLGSLWEKSRMLGGLSDKRGCWSLLFDLAWCCREVYLQVFQRVLPLSAALLCLLPVDDHPSPTLWYNIRVQPLDLHVLLLLSTWWGIWSLGGRSKLRFHKLRVGCPSMAL